MDALRTFDAGDIDYIDKHNANSVDIVTAVTAVENGKQDLDERGEADGYASLDSDGIVPLSQLPDLTIYEETENRGAANGYAPLDETAHIPAEFLPATSSVDFQLRNEKGLPNGYASLDADGIVPEEQLPDLTVFELVALRGQPEGYAALDTEGLLLSTHMPRQPFDIMTFFPGVPGDDVLMYRIKILRDIELLATLPGSVADVVTAPTDGDVQLSIQQNDVEIGQILFLEGENDGSFIFAEDVTLEAGDVLSVLNQATADSTFANVSISIAGTRAGRE